MRYVGLVFLGMVLLSSQAFAKTYEDSEAEKIITSGKIIHMEVDGSFFNIRVIYKSSYYSCYEYSYDGKLSLTCLSVD